MAHAGRVQVDIAVAVGKLGVMPKAVAFDIETAADGSNTGWLLADGTLHKVDLTSGKASPQGIPEARLH